MLKVCTYPLTEYNNRYFSRSSHTELSFFNFFCQSGISSTNWREQPEFCMGLPHWPLFSLVLFYTGKAGVWIDFHLSNLFIFIGFVTVFFPNSISVIIIVEYSTISVLEYFGDTVANAGLPEAWLEYDSNCVTQIEINTLDVSRMESEKDQLSLIKSKPQLSRIKSRNNWVESSQKRLPARNCGCQ